MCLDLVVKQETLSTDARPPDASRCQMYDGQVTVSHGSQHFIPQQADSTQASNLQSQVTGGDQRFRARRWRLPPTRHRRDKEGRTHAHSPALHQITTWYLESAHRDLTCHTFLIFLYFFFSWSRWTQQLQITDRLSVILFQLRLST